MTTVDKIKVWSAALIVVAAVYVAGYELGAGQAAARTGVLAGGLLAAALLAAFSASGRAFFEFAKAAQIELRKVIWPSRQETLRMTGVVLLMVTAVMLFLWAVDVVLGALLDALAS